ncbi:MAG: hypothetical protein E7223_01935 [Clostridiales bacterium]|nr:hypothetical protein [Clostridiales bacterium]
MKREIELEKMHLRKIKIEEKESDYIISLLKRRDFRDVLGQKVSPNDEIRTKRCVLTTKARTKERNCRKKCAPGKKARTKELFEAGIYS